MMMSVTRKLYLRPIRSPRLPKTSAPKGRTTNPAANASSAAMKASRSSSAEKNFAAMIAASEP